MHTQLTHVETPIEDVFEHDRVLETLERTETMMKYSSSSRFSYNPE